MPQTQYNLNSIAAQPGMVYDVSTLSAGDVVSSPASVNIPFGVLCEIVGASCQPVQGANLAGTVTVTNASATITFTTAQTLPQGQALVFSDQPGVIYYLAAAIVAGTGGTLTQTYSGTGGAAKLARLNPYGTAGELGISIIDPLGVEQQYVTWTVPTLLTGTVSITHNSASITFSVAQTLAAGTQVIFAAQPGVIYQMAAAVAAGTAGTLVSAYSGVTNASTTTTLPQQGSSAKGWPQGSMVPLMRRGRVWAANDGGGTAARLGPINVWHSSTGVNPQGVFTFTPAATAAAMAAGAEIDIAPNVTTWNPNLLALANVDSFGNSFIASCVEILAR